MTFLVDNQLPPALARFIEQDLGTAALHVQDLNMQGYSDLQLWTHAAQHDLILISKDEDFAVLYSQSPNARLLWVRLANCRKTELLHSFKQVWPRVLEAFQRGERFIELR
ncbi:MAG: DUF5615 family PIN-like protein [Acidobacteria bacterium]|nr:DUF5615 family PIN-like protein [Acidobacteriota bacterium]